MKKLAIIIVVMLLLVAGCASREAVESKQENVPEVIEIEDVQNQKSDAVINAERAILAIGEVTEESEDAITYAEKAFDFLTDNEQEQVSNRMDLFNAKISYYAIIEEKPAPILVVTTEEKTEPVISEIAIDLKNTTFKRGRYNCELYPAFVNNSSFSIDRVDFYVNCYNAYGEYLGRKSCFDDVFNEPIKANAKYKSDGYYTLYDGTVRIEIAIARYHTKEGQEVKIPDVYLVWESMERMN